MIFKLIFLQPVDRDTAAYRLGHPRRCGKPRRFPERLADDVLQS
jgi:hypothetical protein